MMRKRALHFLVFLCLPLVFSAAETKDDVQGRLKADVEFLASDNLEGREAGKRGNEVAALFIRNRLIQLGYQRLPGAKGMLLPFGQGATRCSNVAAWLPGSGDEVLVLGAHFDHIGFGDESAITRHEEDGIYNGANDNASGVAGMLEVARALKGERGLVRSLVIVAFNAEEKGLFGSLDFSQKIGDLLPEKKIVAMMNLDMIGHMPDRAVKIMGSESSSELTEFIEKSAKKMNLRWVNDGYIPLSDHHNFYLKKIPVLFFFSGIDEHYHGPNDEIEEINYLNMTEFTLFLTEITRLILNSIDHIDFIEIPKEVTAKSMFKLKISMSSIDLGVNVNENYEVILKYKSGKLKDFDVKIGDKILSVNGIVFSADNIKNIKKENIKEITVLSESKRVRRISLN